MFSILNEIPEVLGFASLYKVFLSLSGCLFSSLLLTRVAHFLSTALACITQRITEEGYTGDKITFFHFCRKLYPVFLPKKRFILQCGQHSAHSLNRQATILLYFIFKEVGYGRRDYLRSHTVKFTRGKITTCVFSSDTFDN